MNVFSLNSTCGEALIIALPAVHWRIVGLQHITKIHIKINFIFMSCASLINADRKQMENSKGHNVCVEESSLS
jgi:hypothetical protein